MTTDTNRRTMTAIARDAYGGPEVLRTMTIPVPEPADNEVLVEVQRLIGQSGRLVSRDRNPLPLSALDWPTQAQTHGAGHRRRRTG